MELSADSSSFFYVNFPPFFLLSFVDFPLKNAQMLRSRSAEVEWVWVEDLLMLPQRKFIHISTCMYGEPYEGAMELPQTIFSLIRKRVKVLLLEIFFFFWVREIGEVAIKNIFIQSQAEHFVSSFHFQAVLLLLCAVRINAQKLRGSRKRMAENVKRLVWKFIKASLSPTHSHTFHFSHTLSKNSRALVSSHWSLLSFFIRVLMLT